MLVNIWHGSENIIKKPKFGSGKAHNDYGQGFYCTKDINMAREWAVRENKSGYANEYVIDDSGLSVLDLQSDDYNVLHWITILLQNRIFDLNTPLAKEAYRYLTETFSLPYQEYDVIIGYRADDSYFSFAKDFVNGTISVRQLSEALRLGNLGEQYVLKSRRAFNRVEFIGYEAADSRMWYPKKEARELKARSDYHNTDKNVYIRGDIFITKIIDEEMKPDDTRLQ